MATCRTVTTGAMQALGVLPLGRDPVDDELYASLDAITDLLWELHAARGLMTVIDALGDYVASENQRIRVQYGVTAAITLPNSCAALGAYNPYDYGFGPTMGFLPSPGSVYAADGVNYRPIRDGSRIEIVGTTQALYFYRSDLNSWMPVNGLTLDAELPLNASYAGHFAARLAERMADVLGAEISPTLARRIGRANAALLLQPGIDRDPIGALLMRRTSGSAGGSSSTTVVIVTPPPVLGGGSSLDFSDPANSGLIGVT